MKKLVTPIAVASFLALAGCNNTDPSQGGFFGGVGGLASGNYQQRTNQMNQGLQDEQDKKVRLERQYQNTQDQQASISKQADAQEAKLASVNRDINSMKAQLATAQQQNKIAEQTRAKLEQDLKDLELDLRVAQIDPGSTNAEKQAKVASLERRKQALQDTLAAALKR